jgi:GNAT superfamily N-acetyltransferase
VATVETRRATDGDFPAILGLAQRALGWADTDERFLTWKHRENPFGMSPMWVAVDGARIVGFRTFLRWELVRPDGVRVRAVRAVDTATDPDYQGQGIFTRLTLDALEALNDDGVDLVFNTPNGRSLPGYLKMGWHEVGRLPVAVMPTSLRFPLVVGSARRGAGREGVPTTVGAPVSDVLADDAAVAQLLQSLEVRGGLETRRTGEFLRWRYGLAELGYRALTLSDGSVGKGVVIFRLRRRCDAIEGVVCDVLVPWATPSAGRALVRMLARQLGADYLIRIDGHVATRDPFIRLPRVGPVLACRPIGSAAIAPTALNQWALTMGDVELF